MHSPVLLVYQEAMEVVVAAMALMPRLSLFAGSRRTMYAEANTLHKRQSASFLKPSKLRPSGMYKGQLPCVCLFLSFHRLLLRASVKLVCTVLHPLPAIEHYPTWCLVSSSYASSLVRPSPTRNFCVLTATSSGTPHPNYQSPLVASILDVMGSTYIPLRYWTWCLLRNCTILGLCSEPHLKMRSRGLKRFVHTIRLSEH